MTLAKFALECVVKVAEAQVEVLAAEQVQELVQVQLPQDEWVHWVQMEKE